MTTMTRRELLLAAAAPLAAAPNTGKPSLCIFSKHLPKLDYDGLGRQSKEFGFDGVDLTVRPKGHVLPQNAARDLPRAVAAIRAHGVSVPMITTGLTAPDDPAAEPTLRAAGGLGIPFFKVGYTRYKEANILDQLAACKPDLAGLVAIGKEHGVAAGYHNHSGNFLGAAVWDIREMMRDLDPKWAGHYFDPCHATIEGGKFGWRASLDIALPRLNMIAVKDFYWEKRDGEWNVNWCPLGEGMVDWDRFFGIIAKARFTGAISLHVEYDADDEHDAIAKDLAFLKRKVSDAYGS